MKTMLTAVLVIAILMLFVAPCQSLAQVPDTVQVSANPPGAGGITIEKFISGDTTATGARKNPNRVYVLQQTGTLDTVYYYYDPIYAKSSINIVGKTNPKTGMPPIIQPFIRADNSSPTNFVISSSKSTTIAFRNLYFLSTRYDSVQATADLIRANADSTTVIIDHCVVDNSNGNLANFYGNRNDLFLSNTEYRNGSNQFWQSGNAMWATNGVPMDTVIIRNNTFFCMGRAVWGGPGYYQYLLFDHNTCFLGTGGLLLSPRLSNAILRNNIFYGVIAHGADSSYIKTAGANAAKQGFGIVMMDSMATVGTQYGITEAQRNVTITNNVYYWPTSLVNFWKSYNDTAASTKKLVPPKWMNEQTAAMFNNKTGWPGFAASKNDSTDPGFAASLAGPAVDSLVKFVRLIGYPAGNAGNYRWWQLRTNPDPVSVFSRIPAGWKGWQAGYPVPENLRYSNTSLQSAGTDGRALGDLNWFPEQITAVEGPPNSLPAQYELGNNYPNPFNPTTKIEYSVPRTGVVTLKMYNLLGQDVATLFSGLQQPGNYVATFDGSKLTSGVYFYRLEAGSVTITKKLMLLK